MSIFPQEPYSKLKAIMFLAVFVLFVLPLWTVASIVCIPLTPLSKKIQSFAKECFSVWAVGFRYFSSKKCQYAAGSGRPILFVHGYLHNASGWHKYMHKLLKGVGPMYAINLGDGPLSPGGKFWSIRRYAKQVEEAAKTIAKKTGRKDLILIGHSMGGLISALYATQLAPRKTVTDVITIGSPLHGAPLVKRLGIGPNGKEMEPNSPLLKEIRNGIEKKQSDIRFYHIASKTDELVPYPSALLKDEQSDRHFVVDNLGHLNLMTSKRVANQIRSWLS